MFSCCCVDKFVQISKVVWNVVVVLVLHVSDLSYL